YPHCTLSGTVSGKQQDGMCLRQERTSPRKKNRRDPSPIFRLSFIPSISDTHLSVGALHRAFVTARGRSLARDETKTGRLAPSERRASSPTCCMGLSITKGRDTAYSRVSTLCATRRSDVGYFHRPSSCRNLLKTCQ